MSTSTSAMSWSVERLRESATYLTRDFWLQHVDKRVASYWLTRNGLLNTLYILAVYLLLVRLILPLWMRRRPAMSLKPLMIGYNICMSLANLYFFLWFFSLSRGGRELFNFVAPSQNDTSPWQMELIQFAHLYLCSKFIDLFDTVFFVLRKKNSQLTPLHLYHHSIVPLLLNISFILYPSAMAAGIFAFFNSMVHTLMYAYYSLSAIGPVMAPYLWWKKYITQLQIMQFSIFIFFAIAYSCFSQGYSMAYVWIGISQGPLFFVLFTRFYLRSYSQLKKTK